MQVFHIDRVVQRAGSASFVLLIGVLRRCHARVKLQHSLQQNVRPVFNVFGTRELFRGVTDAADAGDEDHPDRPDVGDLLRVVACAAGHELGGETGQVHHVFICSASITTVSDRSRKRSVA